MKHLLLITTLFMTLGLSAQIKVKITGNIFNFKGDSVSLSQIISNRYVDYLKAAVDAKGNFTLEGKVPAPDYYIFKVGSDFINVIIRPESNIQIYADGARFREFCNIINSEESVKLNEFVMTMQYYNYRKDSANAYLQRHPEQERAVNESFTPIYLEFKMYKERFLSENPNSPALVPLLSVLDPRAEFEVYEQVVTNLLEGFKEAPSVRQVEQQYLQLKAEREALSFLDPGKMAPDFKQADVKGKEMKLSDLKGQVVLLDFWASWCGPCRKENPNVVRLYEKYKKEGFTVMSVSLDNDKQRWLDAIAKDGLTWPNHVSDLKGWKNEAAAMYKVTGIPFAILLDKEGKIIDRNLRGVDLENKLREIFGH